jgi:hypothetical protein
MFGSLAAARPIQEPLAQIEPQFDQPAGTYDAAAGDLDCLSAAPPDEQDLERPQNTSAVDGALLSLIPFAFVFAIVAVLFGASFLIILPSRENLAAQKVEEPKATVTSWERTVLPRQATATPPVTPASLPHVATPNSLPEGTYLPDKPTPIPPSGQTYPPPAASTIRPLQTALSEEVVQNGLASPATNPASPLTKVLPGSQQKPREARIRFLRDQVAKTEQQLTRPNLSAAETRRLERQRAYWGRTLERALVTR